MVGFYPDIPASRMAYDRDGTQVYLAAGGFTSIASQLTTAEVQNLNKENSSYSVRNQQFVIYFPEARDLRGYWIGSSATGMVSAAVSTNSTNGIDGTWTTIPNNLGVSGSPVSMRTGITTVTQDGIRAIRIRTGDNAGSGGSGLHLYGTPSAGANPDRLEFWHPVLNQALSATPAYFDWGDRPRATALVKQVRVKNLSATGTANSITVGVEAPTDTSPTMVSQTALSLDGTSYSSPSVVLPASLVPGDISGLISVRQTLLVNSTLSLWTQRLYAVAGSWS